MARTCEICGNRSARYVCQECGRSACEFCFLPERWLCIECYKKLAYQPTPLRSTIETGIDLPVKLFMAGFIITFVGAIILMLASLYSAYAQGGFIWIFPLPPFFFGADQEQIWPLTAIAAIFMIIFTVFLILTTYRIFRKVF